MIYLVLPLCFLVLLGAAYVVILEQTAKKKKGEAIRQKQMQDLAAPVLSTRTYSIRRVRSQDV